VSACCLEFALDVNGQRQFSFRDSRHSGNIVWRVPSWSFGLKPTDKQKLASKSHLFGPVLQPTMFGVFGVVLLLSGCSGEMVPPGEVLAVSQPSTPMMMAQPSAPAMFPVSNPMSEGSLLSSSADADPILDGEGDYRQTMRQELAPANPQIQEPQIEPDIEKQGRFAFLPRISNPLARPEWVGGMPASERNCRSQLKRLGVVYDDISGFSKGNSCGISHPVKVSGFSGGIALKPAATLNCQITLAFAKWVKRELAPAARARYLSGVSSIKQMSSYACRTMNSESGAPMSEHSTGNAIDVGGVTLNNGRTIDVREPGFFNFREKSLLSTVRADSCDYFTTVLGPGYNQAHADHFHFDLRDRRQGYKTCK